MSDRATSLEVENLNEITDVIPTSLTGSGNFKVSVEEGTITGADGALLDGVNSAIKATVLDYANSNPLAVRLTDTNGDYVGAGAGTEYTEDAAAPADPVGKAIMVTRDDALSTVTEAEGDWSRLRGTAEGALWVQDFNSDAIKTSVESLDDIVKEEDAAHSSGDKGVMALSIRKDNVEELAGADGDYQPLTTNEHGILRSQAQQHLSIDSCGSTSGWSVLGNDTTNLTTTTNHVFGALALEFDKVNGTDNTKFAGIQKTISPISMAAYHKGGGFFIWSTYLSDITDVDYLFLRLGTDSSNYNEFRISSERLTAGWITARAPMSFPSEIVGNGWNSQAVTYIAIGVAFNSESDTLADIAIDHIAANTGLQTSTDISAEVSSSVSTPNVNVLKIKNKVVNTQAGNVGTGTQRVTIATDDVNLSAIASDTTSIDGKITACDTGNVTISSALPAGNNNIGNVDIVTVPAPLNVVGGGTEASALRVTIANNSSGVVSIDDGGGSLTVDATDLDIRDLSKDQDSVLMYANTAKDGSGTDYIPLVDADGHLQVDILSGGTSGTQYTEGDVDASITGTAMMAEGGSDTLYSLQVDANKYLKVAQQGNVTVDLNSVTPDLMLGTDFSNVFGTASVVSATPAVKVEEQGTVNVADGGGSLTVDGSVSIGSALPAGTNNIGDVDVLTLPSIPAGTNLIGNVKISDGTETVNVTASNELNVLDSNSAAIKTAVETIDNCISGSEAQVDVVAALPAGTNTIGKVAPNEYELAGNTTHVKKYYTHSGAVTDGIIWSPAAGKRWYITDIFINVSADATVTLEDDLSGGDSVIWKAELAANSGWSHSFTTPLYSGEDAADLTITTSAGNVYALVVGYEV